MILIITSKPDGHIGAVTRHLDAAGAPWVRLNTEDIAQNLDLTIEPALGTGSLHIKDSGRKFNLQDVQAVWYRKPETPQVGHFQLDAGSLDYVQSEFREILDNLYALLPHVPWINNPFHARIAHRKMLQLKVAAKVGFRVPETLVTNSPDAALRFAAKSNCDLAIKSLGALSAAQGTGTQTSYGLFTRRVTRAELLAVKDKIANLSTTFQPFIPKACELRVTCVGDRIFTCRIQARPGDLTADDYRFDTQNLTHTATEAPNLHSRIHDYMREFNLNFACFDFIVPLKGEPVFLEANANGQFAWVENLTGLPIAKAIADELMSHTNPPAHPPAELTAKDIEFLSASLSNEDFRRFCRNRNHARH